MSNKKSTIYLFVVLLFSASIIFWGCNNKTDNPDGQSDNGKTEMENPDQVADNTGDQSPAGNEMTGDKEEPVEEPMVTIPDLKGEWTGTFDNRNTVLTITVQTDSSFSGKLSIKYKEMLYQEVKGNFSPTTKKFSMEDQIHSKFMGKYKGTLSEDNKNLSGIFTMNRDGAKTSFNLNKK